MNIAVFLPNWIGDVVMATPTLNALRNHFGTAANITGIMRPYVAEVLSGSSWIDEHLYYHPRARGAGQGTWQLVRSLRRRSIDLAVLLPNSFRSAVVAWLGGAKQRVGYLHNSRGLLLTKRVKLPRNNRKRLPTSAIDLYLELAHQIGCPPHPPRTHLETTSAEEEVAGQVYRALGIGAHEEVVLLNPAGGGNATDGVRSWPVESFAELARRTATRFDVHVLAICGPSEEQAARNIVRLADHPRVHSLADHPVSIGPLKACVRRAGLMVTTDTGPRHFAAAFDVPHVVLCGPIDPRWSDNHHPREIHLTRDLPCRPCDKRDCPLGHRSCMREITVDEAFAAVVRQLEESEIAAIANQDVRSRVLR